jgi:hypothetical protein
MLAAGRNRAKVASVSDRGPRLRGSRIVGIGIGRSVANGVDVVGWAHPAIVALLGDVPAN